MHPSPTSQYNYPEIIAWLQSKGMELFGNKFTISPADHLWIHQLVAYFLRDEKACLQNNIDLEKGILLAGPIGCGKTTWMHLMKFVAQTNHKFILKSCREVSFEFIQEGYQTIHKYSIGQLYHAELRNYCFDDLGVESNLKYYGNECNVMAEIMLSRYDLFVSKKLITHITTNLSASEIESTYGNRVRSRMREMFNLIAFPPNSPDKR